MDALQSFGGELRRCLEAIVGDTLPDRSWSLAQLGVKRGGLGIRDPVRHASAAYLGSLLQTRDLCCKIDPGYDVDDVTGGLHVAATETELRSQVLEAASWDQGGIALSQKALSGLIDGAQRHQLLQEQSGDRSFCAHVALCGLPGAGAWLTAPPVQDDREIDSPLFQVAVKRRLRVPVFGEEDACPRCGDVLDVWGDHCMVCSCGGNRTIRHNVVRNICYEEARDASLRPEREKANLLPDRPVEDGLPSRAGSRRPADVWIPRGEGGRGEALDFAISSGMQSNLFSPVADNPGLVFCEYERMKREYKNTAQLCQDAGFAFSPVVFEAHAGGWSPLTRAKVDWLTKAQAASQHEDPSIVSLRIAQRISCALQRENARAILQRSGGPSDDPCPAVGWDEVAP